MKAWLGEFKPVALKTYEFEIAYITLITGTFGIFSLSGFQTNE